MLYTEGTLWADLTDVKRKPLLNDGQGIGSSVDINDPRPGVSTLELVPSDLIQQVGLDALRLGMMSGFSEIGPQRRLGLDWPGWQRKAVIQSSLPCGAESETECHFITVCICHRSHIYIYLFPVTEAPLPGTS